MEFKLYELPNYAFNRYRRVTKGNRDISHEEAQKKLSRNIALASVIHNGYRNKLFVYGCLMIKTNQDKIVGIWNNKRPDDEWELHKKKFKKLNNRLGITSNRVV